MKPRLLAPLLFLATLALYLYTLQPSLAWGDGIRLQHEAITAESFILDELVDVQFAPDPFPFARVGVAAWDHPLYIYLGHTLVRLLPALDPLWVVNAVSALFAAGAIALLFLVFYEAMASRDGALFGALALAVSHTFWWHTVTPEVYSLFTFLLLLVLLFYARYERNGKPRTLALALFALGLGAANHLLALLALPAWLLYRVIGSDAHARLALTPSLALPRVTAPPWRRLLLYAVAFLLGFSPYLVQFLRLLRTFPLGELLGPAAGATFVEGSLALTPAALAASFVSYLTFLFYQFTPVGVLLGLYGFWRGRRVDAGLWRKTVALYLVYFLFGLVYRVTDQFAFFLGAHVIWALAMGLGVTLLQRLSAPVRRWLAAILGAILLLTPLLYQVAPGLLRAVGIDDRAFGVPQIGTGVRDGLAYYLTPNKRGDTTAYRFGHDTLAALPPHALILAHMYSDTDEYFVFRYLTEVEKMRPDVELVGWPTEDPFDFDPTLATELIAARLPAQPIYLASLSDDYYAAGTLVRDYCVVLESNLYRLYPRDGAHGDCIEEVQ